MADTSVSHSYESWEEESYRIGCEAARREAQKRLSRLEYDLFAGKPTGWRVEGWRERTLVTRFGEVKVKRRLYRDKNGKHHFLLDEHLGWVPYRAASPSMTESVVRLASFVPFRTVAETIEDLTDGVVSAKSVHNLTQQVGGKAECEEEEAWRACFERGEEVGAAIPPGRQVEQLYTEADGVWVHTQREERQHYEVKSAIAYAGWAAQGQDRYRLVGKRVYCHANENIPFWEGASLEWAKQYDLANVETVIVGGDGANWVEAGTGEFARSVLQLDGFHLARACGRGFGKELGRQVYEAIRGGCDQEARRLIDTAPPEEGKTAQQARKYVNSNVAKGMDWRVQIPDVPIGARGLGTMESNGDKLVANRMKKRGLSWSIKGAQRMAKTIQLRSNAQLGPMCRRSRESNTTVPRSTDVLSNSANGHKSDGLWLQASIPALAGPHHNRPWAQTLHSIAHPTHRLN
jgi:hypothetical protein